MTHKSPCNHDTSCILLISCYDSKCEVCDALAIVLLIARKVIDIPSKQFFPQINMESRTIYTQATLLIAVSVGVWWAANSITAVSSKSFMRGTGKPDTNSWSDAILDFRWLELTTLQHLVGAVVSIAWLKTVGKSVWPSEASKKIILLASLGNVAGNIATNAAYAMVSSSMTQVVKACEPLFMFGLSLLLYKDYQVLNSTTLLSIVVMVFGASLFVANDSTFLVSGLLAALCSNVAFPIRNIYLSSVWESSFQKYAVVSIYSVLVLTPLVVAKVLLFQSFTFTKKWGEGFISASCHCTYNIASIYVLQNFTPLTHAILNLLKRGIVIFVNLVYFQLPLSWKMVLGLGLLFAGLYMYVSKGKKFPLLSIVVVIAVITLGILFLLPLNVIQRTEVSQIIENKVKLEVHPRLNFSFNTPQKFVQHKVSTFQRYSMVNVTSKANLVRSAWVFDRPMSKKILSNLETLSTKYRISVYCGTSRCIQAINDLSNENISTSFLLIKELVQDTPFEGWLARHLFYKVLAEGSYEDHLQEVVRLAILWKHGGLYVEPNVYLMGEKQQFPSCISNPWVGKLHANDSIQHFEIACFPKHSKFINKLSAMFTEQYYKPPNSKFESTVPTMNIDSSTWHSYLDHAELPTIVEIDFRTLSTETDQPWNHHYATLSYHSRVKLGGINIGDEIQGYPGLQFLPFVDNFLDRDNLFSNENNDQHIEAFFNAWWGDGKAKWPPQSNIDPIFLSVHINDEMKPIWKKDVDYLLPRAPIGCRDLSTVDFLTKLGVSAFFSGCMTLMIQWKADRPRTDEILIVDVKPKFYQSLPAEIRKKGTRVTHIVDQNFEKVSQSRFTEAFRYIERYSRAKLVITQRIHCALPCVAMGTPVVFINGELPGDMQFKASRIAGLSTLFHSVQTRKDDLAAWFAKFPWDNPPPNPDMATHMRLRAAFWYEVRKRPSLYDAGLKFGVVPMSPPTPCVDRVQFHIHFPHRDDHFTWQDHRSVESIFCHHPCASVLIHSNTLNDERFGVFRESGYVIETQTYDHTSFINPASGNIKEQHISNTYLVRALILYKWGGVYMDSNIILTKSVVPDLSTNFIVWRDSSEREVDPSFMRFEKGNKFLKSVATKFAADPDNHGDSFYTEVLQEAKDKVKTLDSRTVYVFDNAQVNKQCYEVTSGPEYDSWNKTIAESAVAVALSSDYSLTKSIGATPLKEDTLCRKLLHDFCVICSVLL